MATVTKTWTFPSNLEGWGVTLGSGGSLAWSSADGGGVVGGASGRNTGATNNLLLDFSGTYESLGVPAGATITALEFKVDHKCTAYNVVNYLYFDGRVDESAVLSQVSYSGTTAFTTASSGSFSVSKQSGDTVALQLNGSARTASNNAATCQLAWDNVTLVITYETASYDFSGSGSITMSSSVSAEGSKQASQGASVEMTSVVSAGGQKNAIGVAEVSMTPTVTASGTAQEENLDKVGSGSITENFSLSASGAKSGSGSSNVAITSELQSSGSKNAQGDASIGLDATVSSTGSKHVSVMASIAEGFTVYAFGFSDIPNYDRVGYGEIAMSAFVESSGTKSTSGEGAIIHFMSVLSNGLKNVVGLGELTLTFEIVSAYTKVEFTDETVVRTITFTVMMKPAKKYIVKQKTAHVERTVLKNEFSI